ncbi:HEPN domain-containing protein [candidate division KSB1 bacterium]|nr:HEPN domain-containing protein [candidate division KSB1 bacterium]
MPPKSDSSIPGSPEEWLMRAKSNLLLARAEKPEGVFWEDMCYNAQQAAEKAIKAVLQYHHIVFRYIHDLSELLENFEKNGFDFPDDLKQASVLTQYAIETRYPGHFDDLTEEVYRQALAIAERTVAWAESVIAPHAQDQQSGG